MRGQGDTTDMSNITKLSGLGALGASLFAGLPAWARSLGASINGTHLRLTGPGANEFSGYSTRTINWSVTYAKGNFAIKANATYSNGPRNAIVAANATTPS